jgi:glycosyltransferase involved in cell wall biosynthesis
MTLLLVHNAYQRPGGEDGVFRAEAALLREKGHAVVQYRDENARANDMNALSLAGTTIWSAGTQRKIAALLREQRPTVAHFHNTFMLISPAAYYACHAADVPVVQTLHNYRLVCPAAIFYRHGEVCEECIHRAVPWPAVFHGCYRQSRAASGVVTAMLSAHNFLRTWARRVDVYIALSEFARRKFIDGGLPAGKIVDKPNFLEKDPGAREGVGAHALFVGRLTEEKGLWTLLKAWRALQHIPLKIAGDGPLKAKVAEFAQRENLTNVQILGQCSRGEVLVLMKQARFLVFPSQWYEGFPLTIAEAFACAVPVIAARLGALPEIVADGLTGLHFNASDAEDLAAKALWAWSHPDELAEMGRQARATYQNKYTAEHNYEMLMNVYHLAIEARDARLQASARQQDACPAA